MSSDVISVIGVQGFGYHGVLPQERAEGQTFVVDLHVSVDVAPAAKTDDLTQTVDYSALARDALAVIEGEPYQLIETVAERIAERVLAYDRVESARVVVHKPEAPVGVPFVDVQVAVVRSR